MMYRAGSIMAIFFFSIFLTACGNEYVRFQMVEWDHRVGKYLTDDKFSKHDQENIIYVLNVFDEKYYISDDVLYISKKLWNDKDRLWNYCRKADDEWIKQREEMMQEFRKRRNIDD